MTKTLPNNATADRRAHLRAYLLACLQTNLVTWADITDGLSGLRKGIGGDLRAVVHCLRGKGRVPAQRVEASRRVHLEAYIQAGLDDHIFSTADLLDPLGVFDRLFDAASGDLRAVGMELGMNGGKNLLRFIGGKILDVAEGLGGKKPDAGQQRDVGQKLMEMGRR